ncbi:hypothetical protein ACFQLX_02700 [Streptomyces polyrhachis]|uniref:Minor tail protein n=1 Tax=Streptomyces polyrhachis TaxID=1282885 RepID=A0ABW2G8I5_9ACTN
MATYTPLSSLPYPAPADVADLPAHLKALADAADGRTVLRFADAAARDAKITAPVSGMVAWLTTSALLTIYDGNAWISPGVWTAYTPTWTAATTNPTLGDGTLQGRYALVGNTCHFQLVLAMGSTTAFGSGAYTFGLPVPAGATGVLVQFVGNAASTGGRALVSAQLTSTSGATGFTVWGPTSTSTPALGQIGATGVLGSAWAKDSGSFFRISGTYETA